jgi:hypothetical protein
VNSVPAKVTKLQAKRLVRKLKAIREDMLDRMHTAVRERSPRLVLESWSHNSRARAGSPR